MKLRNLTVDSLYYGIANVASALAAFAILPWLSRLLPVGQFGIFVLAMSLIQLGGLITDFGFGMTASRRIALMVNEEDKKSLFQEVTVARCLTWLMSSSLVSACMISLIAETDTLLVIICIASIGALSISPTWYLLGADLPRQYAWASVCARGLGAMLVVIAATPDSSTATLLALVFSPHVLVGYIVLSQFFHWLKPDGWIRSVYSKSITLIRSNVSVFFSQFAIISYSSLSIPILGALVTAETIAEFAIADKIIAAVRMILGSIFNAALPVYSRLATFERSTFRRAVWKLFVLLLIPCLCISVTLFFYSREIVVLIFGENASASSRYLSLMSPIPTLLAASHAFVSIGLLGAGKKDMWSRLMFATAFFYAICVMLLSQKLNVATAMALSITLSEAFLVLVGLLTFRRIISTRL